jgi:uncharacterized membrane protein YadS
VGRSKIVPFLAFLIGVGLLYPLIMSGIFKLDLKTSMIIGVVMGIVGAVIWLVTSNIRQKKRAMKQ